ncbi:MAG: peptidoglycan-binding protein [bacterium]|nr:peptidoglycan-binding protein [bacterium]
MSRAMKTMVGGLALAGLGVTGTLALASDTAADLPPNAKPGECYARSLIPATYTTETEQVLKKEASERIEITPARFEWVEETVLVKEAATKLEVVPAKYRWVEETLQTKPESTKMVEVPARYEWTEEKILVKPAQTVWKKGRGPVEKVDNGTGEIMCLVEEPAVYKTVRKRVLKNAAKTETVQVSAEHKTIKKRVLAEPAKTREVEIPAEYETVRVRKLVSPPQERRIEIPAEYETVSKRVSTSDSRLVWKPVLCETNLRAGIVADVQRALSKAGHNPGPIDGVIGKQTMAAVTSFQRSKGMATGGLTMEAIEALNVRVN